MDWDLFYTCIDAIISANNDSWAIFHHDEYAPGRKGALQYVPRRVQIPYPWDAHTPQARYLSDLNVSYIHY